MRTHPLERQATPQTHGFTLVELLVVIVILGVLAAVAVPIFLSQSDNASDAALKSELTSVARLLQAAEASGETLPSQFTAGELVTLGSAGSFTASQNLTVSGSGETLCVEGVSESGDVYSADLDNGIRDYDCAGIQSGALVMEGLVLRLDAGDPDSYPGAGTTWTDVSGNSNDGALSSGVTHVVGEIPSMSFNGANDFVEVAQPGISTSPNRWTICLWMKPGNKTAFFVNPYSSGIDSFLWYSPSSQHVRIRLVERTDTNGRDVSSTGGSVPLGQWTHVCASIDHQIVKLHINGSLNRESTQTIPIANWVGKWAIGKRWNNTHYYLGEISTFSVYDRALTNDEVQQNYDAVRHRFGL